MRRVAHERLPTDATQRRALAEQSGADGKLLLQAAEPAAPPMTLRQLTSRQVLGGVWQQTDDGPAGQVKWRAGPRMRSPDDAAARTGKKRETPWQGYQVQVTERCEQAGVQLRTPGATTPAKVTDGQRSEPIQQDWQKRGRAPGAPSVDTGAPDAPRWLSSPERGLELLGPVAGPSRWQPRAGPDCGAADCASDGQRPQLTCRKAPGCSPLALPAGSLRTATHPAQLGGPGVPSRCGACRL